jgi:nucleotide-binding universal stress UspA family protein
VAGIPPLPGDEVAMNIPNQNTVVEQVVTPEHRTPSFAAACHCPIDDATSALDAGAGVAGIKNILVCADSSKSLLMALKYARVFAEHFQCKLTILYSTAADSSAANPQELPEEMTRVAGIKSRHLRATFVHQGGVSEAQITNAARKEAADLIIISADFASGPRHFFQESAIVKVIRHAPCPVLAVGNEILDPV